MSDQIPSGIPPVPPVPPEAPPPQNPYTPTGAPVLQGAARYFQEPPGTAVAATQNDRTMGMLCHLTALSGFLIPLGNLLGPLIVWLTQKDKSAFADDQGKEALNFQITVLIAGVISGILCLLLIGFLLLIALGIYWLVLTIIAAIKANEGVAYRYPWTLRFIK